MLTHGKTFLVGPRPAPIPRSGCRAAKHGWTRHFEARCKLRACLRLHTAATATLFALALPVWAFEGRISATLTQGTETNALRYTVGPDHLRIEVTSTNWPNPIDIVDRQSGALTLVYPHNRSFVRLKPAGEKALAGMPGMPGMPMPPGGLPPGIGPQASLGTGRTPMQPGMPPMPPQMPQLAGGLSSGIGPQTAPGTGGTPMQPGMAAMPAMPQMPPMPPGIGPQASATDGSANRPYQGMGMPPPLSNIGPTNLPGTPAMPATPTPPQMPPMAGGLPVGIGPQPSSSPAVQSGIPPMPLVPMPQIPTNVPAGIGPQAAPATGGTPVQPQMPAPQAGTLTPPGPPAMPRMPMPRMPMSPMMMNQKLELAATGQTTNILGFACQQYQLKQRGETVDIWATDQLLPFQPYVRNQPHRFGPQMLEEQWGALVADCKLFPLVASLRYDSGAERLRFEVTSVSTTKIVEPNEKLFQPPPDYHEVQPLPF